MTLVSIAPINDVFTDTTFTTAVAPLKRVFWRVLVTILAVSRQDSWTDSYMRFSSERLKMLWIHAGSRLTKVMKIYALRYRSIEQFVDKTVRPKGSILTGQQTVAKFVQAGCPEPATGIRLNVNLFLEARR